MIREVNVSVAITRNLGDYNNVKLQAGAVATVKDGEDPESVYEAVWAVAQKQIEVKLTEALEALEND